MKNPHYCFGIPIAFTVLRGLHRSYPSTPQKSGQREPNLPSSPGPIAAPLLLFLLGFPFLQTASLPPFHVCHLPTEKQVFGCFRWELGISV